MPRSHRTTLTLSAVHFSPLQLHPHVVLGTLTESCSEWMRDNLAVSHRAAISDHALGFVVLSADVTYPSPLTFFDADELDVHTTTAFRADGAVLLTTTELSTAAPSSSPTPSPCTPTPTTCTTASASSTNSPARDGAVHGVVCETFPHTAQFA